MNAHDMTEAKAPAATPPRRRRERYAAGDVQIRAANAEPKGAKVIWMGRRLHLQLAIETDDRVYFLRGAFMLRLLEEDGVSIARSDLLSLEGYGGCAEEAIDDFCESFDVQYRALVEAEESELSPGALAVRAAIRKVVDRIVDEE